MNSLSKIKILIADDEPNQLELIRFNLTKENFEVISASDGEEALCLSEEIFPDLMITFSPEFIKLCAFSWYSSHHCCTVYVRPSHHHARR